MLENRYEFSMFVQAKYCNPNGNPDGANYPRVDEDTEIGYITDVAIKRKIRDYIIDGFEGVDGMDIVIREKIALKDKTKNITSDKDACEKFFDVRAFGAVITKGTNNNSIPIKGPVQLEMAKSLSPITPTSVKITRVCKTDASDKEKENGTFGEKQIVPYGLYRINGYISANLANKTGFNNNDLDILLEALMNMCDNNNTSSKSGMTVVGPIVIFKHIGYESENNLECLKRQRLLGCCSAEKLQKLIDVKEKNNIEFPRDYTDYLAKLHLSELPKGIAVGLKKSAFEPIEWENLSDEWFEIV